MGNCLATQEKVVKIMKTDGKILEYRAPIKVNQVLSEYTGQAVCSMLPALLYLQPDTELIAGFFYYLVPAQTPSPKTEKKKVKFSSMEQMEQEVGRESAGLKIKIVMSKQQLKEMIANRVFTVDGKQSLFQNKNEEEDEDLNDDKQRETKRPRFSLESSAKTCVCLFSMGNCLKAQEKVVKIMKMDRKILEYTSSIKVHQVLSEYRGEAVTSTFLALSFLQPDTKLIGGFSNYLVPIQTPSPKTEKRKAMFTSMEREAGRESTGLKIKLVISKQQLR
ncbi:hypothetical protein Droror1_Dr00008929 [Drosera rotundifolia]